jgi:HD-like signal output (HDOD) protein
MSFSLDLRYQICMQPIELPIFNPVALELLQLLADPDIEMKDIKDTIDKDPSLCVQTLKLANSSAYVGRSKAETIKDAVNRLGAEKISNLAMAVSQSAVHTSKIPVVNKALQELWHHSYACAIGCRSLALRTHHKALAERAYLAGLLHDIGKLYLLKALENISMAPETRFELDHETLSEVFSDMHIEQGCRVMEYWDIPVIYESVVAYHHADYFDTQDELLAIVRLVNFYSVQFGLNLYPRLIQPDDAAAEISALKVSEADLAKLKADMSDSLHQ